MLKQPSQRLRNCVRLPFSPPLQTGRMPGLPLCRAILLVRLGSERVSAIWKPLYYTF